MKAKLKVMLIVAAALAAIPVGVVSYRKAECYSFSATTGYWVKFDPLNGCFVLIDNQYLVEKSLLRPDARPALDPEIVGIDAAIKQDMENSR